MRGKEGQGQVRKGPRDSAAHASSCSGSVPAPGHTSEALPPRRRDQSSKVSWGPKRRFPRASCSSSLAWAWSGGRMCTCTFLSVCPVPSPLPCFPQRSLLCPERPTPGRRHPGPSTRPLPTPRLFLSGGGSAPGRPGVAGGTRRPPHCNTRKCSVIAGPAPDGITTTRDKREHSLFSRWVCKGPCTQMERPEGSCLQCFSTETTPSSLAGTPVS